MPTVVELERLRALVERLLPLAAVQRGDVIRADNWNVVVESLIELARAVTTLETGQDVPLHEHIGEVSLDWFDTELRQLVERGPLNDPVATSRVLRIEQRATELGNSIASVGATLKGLRERLDETITRDLLRERSVVQMTQKVDGMADGREDVLALRRTLDTIRKDLGTVIEMRGNLDVGGRMVNMKTFNERVVELESMRDRLRMPGGKVLDGIALEQRLQETENKFVSRAELDKILGRQRVQLSDDDIRKIQGDIRVQLATDLEKISKDFDARMSKELNSRFADVEKLVAGVVADSIPALRASLADTLRTDLTSIIDSRTKGLQAELDNKLAQLRKDFDLKIDRGFKSVQDDMAIVQGDIPQLRGQVDAATTTANRLAGDMDRRFAAERADIRQTLDSRLAAALADSARQMQDAITQGHRDSLAETRDLVSTELAAGLRKLEGSIDSRIQDGVKKGVATQVDSLVDSAVSRRITDLEKGLRDTVNAEVKRAIAESGGRTETQTGSDFTRISGIGAAFAERIRSNGITTYAELAKVKPAELAAMLGRPESEAAAMIKEAARLARVG